MSTDDKPTRARGGQPRNGSARKHGHHARKLVLKDVRLTDISRQNAVGRLVADKAEAIMTDCGGRANLSELQQDLVSRYVTTELLIQSIDCYLLSLPSIVNRRKKTAIPILLDRNRLSETSLKIATALGLERRQPPPMDLKTFLAERAATEQNGTATETPPEGAAASPAQRDAREPAPQPRATNGRFSGTEDEQIDDSTAETA